MFVILCLGFAVVVAAMFFVAYRPPPLMELCTSHCPWQDARQDAAGHLSLFAAKRVSARQATPVPPPEKLEDVQPETPDEPPDPFEKILEANPELLAPLSQGDAEAWGAVYRLLVEQNPREYRDRLRPAPTKIPAGSEIKINLIAERVAAGYQATSPNDAEADPENVDKLIVVSRNGAPMRAGLRLRGPQK